MSLTEAWSFPATSSLSVDPSAPSTCASNFFVASAHPHYPSLSSPPHARAPTVSPPTPRRRKMQNTSSLPNPKELSKEDDWTRVKDPKEKKRIQNRVAQRTYRHRMKARLGELQARLDSHERRNAQQATHDNSDPSNTLSHGCSHPYGKTPINATNNGGIMAGQSPTINGYGAESSPSPIQGDKMHVPMQMLRPNMYEQPMEEGDSSIYQQGAQFLNSPPNSHPSPPSAHNILSPSGQPGPERSVKVPEDFVVDCLRFQSQVLDRLNTLHPQDPCNVGPPSYGASDSMGGNALSRADQVGCVGSFSSAQSDGIEFGFDAPVTVWKTEHLDGSPPSEAMHFTPLAAVPPHIGPPMMDHSIDMRQIPPPMPHGTASLDQRFEGIMQHVKATGFESFDDLVTAYYSNTFCESSPLANEQHLSRNRRLPRVISSVFQATNKWAPWERRGFQEEILKTAESMLVSESSCVRPSLMSQIRPLVETSDGSIAPNAGEALLGMKKSIQNELPNSWALTMALAADNKSPWGRDRSSTALATILLLQCSGRIPNDQLLQLIGACL